MPDQKLKEEIYRLLSSGEIQYKSGLIGCCIKYYLKLPNDSHKYYYKSDNISSKNLNKKMSSHLYTMSGTRLNKQTTIIPFKNIDIKKEDGDEFIQRLNRFRTWVVKEKFVSIQLRFTES